MNMKNKALFALALLSAAQGATASASKVGIIFPTMPQTNANANSYLNSDVFLYSCSDSSCSSLTQVPDYGHITAVTPWTTANGGPGGAAPTTWAFPTMANPSDQFFKFYQKTQDSSAWNSCILEVTQTSLGQGTTCVGSVFSITTNSVQGFTGTPTVSMGASMFPSAAVSAPNPSPVTKNTLPQRSITFVNGTQNYGLCISEDNAKHVACLASTTLNVTASSPGVIPDATLASGMNSALAHLDLTKLNSNSAWRHTGAYGSGKQVYATKMEWTTWPKHYSSTMGPTTIDASLVDGFNTGVQLIASSDMVCGVSDYEGGPTYFASFPTGTVMGTFPKTPAPLTSLCPSGQIANNKGCYSACSYANVTQTNQAQLCCSSPYNNPPTFEAADGEYPCTAPLTAPYVQNTTSNSSGVYTWAYNDWRGTFTCEATGSFTYKLIDYVSALQ